MPDRQHSGLMLDRQSADLLRAAPDAILLGVVRNWLVQLFEAAQVAEIASRRFAGHRDLVQLGLVQVEGSLGFSIEMADGHVRAFYRASILNR